MDELPVLAELHFPHRRVTLRTLSELPEFGDELEVDGVTFTVAGVHLDDGCLPMVLLAGVIGPPVLVGAAGWHRMPEPVA